MTNVNAKTQLSDALRWALEAMQSPAMASADWLAMDIEPQTNSAAALLSDPHITLEQVRKAKSVFKTMRIVGETSADRRIGARMYAAAIAAGIVRHGKRISRQSDRAILKGLQGLLDDRRMPPELSQLAGLALCVLKGNGHSVVDDAVLPPPSPSSPKVNGATADPASTHIDDGDDILLALDDDAEDQ